MQDIEAIKAKRHFPKNNCFPEPETIFNLGLLFMRMPDATYWNVKGTFRN